MTFEMISAKFPISISKKSYSQFCTEKRIFRHKTENPSGFRYFLGISGLVIMCRGVLSETCDQVFIKKIFLELITGH